MKVGGTGFHRNTGAGVRRSLTQFWEGAIVAQLSLPGK